MNKKVPVVGVADVETANLAGLGLEATVALADLAGVVKEGLLGFCADVGLMVMAEMLDPEMTARVGRRPVRHASGLRDRPRSHESRRRHRN